jgi:hypothetical protein
MPTYVNFAALAVQEIRSDALGPLDSVAHPLDPGNYRGTVFRDEIHIGDFKIEVAEGGTGEQVEVDFSLFENGGEPLKFVAGVPKGQKVYAVFHCDGEGKGYHVTLHDGTSDQARFDSRKLGKEDYFIFMPVKPGDYALQSGGKSPARAKLSVEEATPAEAARASSLGATLRLTAKSFIPQVLRVRSGDGVVAEIDTDDAVVIARLGTKKGKKPRRPDSPIRYPGRSILEPNTNKAVRSKK